jgi:pheromone a factor receptor
MYVMYTNIVDMLPLQSFSWHQVLGPHWNIILRVPTGGVLKPDRWIPIAASILLFVFFGLGHDAVEMYWSCLLKIGLGRIYPSLSNHRAPRFKRSRAWYDTLKLKLSDGTRSLLNMTGMSDESR